MTSADPAVFSATAPHLADAVARAEARRAVLERLTVVGMELVEEIRERHVQAPLHPEPRHDPARAFALVSRAVRLTLAFEARIDADILAMRRGDVLSPKWRRSADKPIAYPSTLALGHEGLRVRDAVQSAINAEFDAWDGAMGALDELHERLIEYERQERFVSRPWRECVKVICADLGLTPDWSGWSEETGFAAPAGKPDVKWTMLWSYDPKRSELRRRNAERLGSAEPTMAPLGQGPP